MARKLVTCKHCEGNKNCTRSGGRSCRDCLVAAGRRPKDWAVVRCSYCGGRGKIWIEVADKDEEASAEEQ